jgi:hypothetical protein
MQKRHSVRDAVIKDRWKNRNVDDFIQGTPKKPKFKTKDRARPKCNNDIRDRGLRRQIFRESKRAFNKTVKQTFGLEVVKRVVGISIGLWEVSD